MTLRAALSLLFLAGGVAAAHGQYDPRPTPGIFHPPEVRRGGWAYQSVPVDAGTGRGDWPSCGFTLDQRADARSVDAADAFGSVGRSGTRVTQATGTAVGCVEMFVPQASCTVKVYLEGSAGTFQQMEPRAPGGRGIGLTPSSQNVGVAMAPATGSARPGCYVQLRNWSGDPRKFLVIWPPA